MKKTKGKPRSIGIAETYININSLGSVFTSDQIKSYLDKHAKEWAQDYFGMSIIVKVRVEDGSLKIWVFVGAITIYNLISGYGSFRSGIDHLVNDAKHFSEFVIEQFKEDENIPSEAIVRTERRLGIPGKIQRYLRKLDKLTNVDASGRQRQELIEELKEEFFQIMTLLDNTKDIELLIHNTPENIKQGTPHQLHG